jgi:glycosyltransferase involved in cell wall biosynthesis
VYREGRVFPSEEQKMVLRFFAREADAVFVSTDRLRDRLLGLNRNVWVIPNALDERLLPRDLARPVRPDGPWVLGYMGTYTHDGDLMMVLEALRRALYRHRAMWRMELVGVISDPSLLDLFRGLPVAIRDPSSYSNYTNFMKWICKNIIWDLAIAPLEDTPFNSCKSDIKFLDYSAFGIPGIYSRVPAYEATVRHLETGYLADNTVEAWAEALEVLMADTALRRSIAANARAYLLRYRTLGHCAIAWKEAILRVL